MINTILVPANWPIADPTLTPTGAELYCLGYILQTVSASGCERLVLVPSTPSRSFGFVRSCTSLRAAYLKYIAKSAQAQAQIRIWKFCAASYGPKGDHW